MINREARDKFAELVRHLANGRITEKDFDTALESLPFSGKDRIFEAIFEETFSIKKTPRRDVARWILFLQSELEYEWPGMEGLPSLIEVVVGVVFCLILRSFFHSASIAWWATVAVIVIGQLIYRFHDSKMRKPGDLKAWPFRHFSNLEEAIRHPHLLNGRRQ